MMWREWMVAITKSPSGQEGVTVSLQAFVHPDVENQPLCRGYVSSFYGNPGYQGTCAVPPFGNGLFLNGTYAGQDINSQTWTVMQAGETGTFKLVASSKPSECVRYMGLRDCDASVVLVDDSSSSLGETSTYAAWKIMRRYDVVPIASPPASAPPTPTAVAPSTPNTPSSPALSIPGPVISAPRETYLGYVDVAVQAVGGNSDCLVSSIVVTATGNIAGSAPKVVEVPANRPGLNTIGVLVPIYNLEVNSIYAMGNVRRRGRFDDGAVKCFDSHLLQHWLNEFRYKFNPSACICLVLFEI